MSKDIQEQPKQQLETGTYEILQKRLQKAAKDLTGRLDTLNTSRKEVFGSIETKLVATERITTAHNCVPQDIIPVGNRFIFGYNVHLGLKAQAELGDVFSVYRYEDHTFFQEEDALLDDGSFREDLEKLYKYYKDTQFVKFALMGPHIFMIFRIGKSLTDIKAFKWLIEGDKLRYLDNRSEHEFRFPDQHEFRWKRATRDQHRQGAHPHISIEDRIFVETVGGDLTIKVEDNTREGQGIYSEAVDNKDQTLDDADIQYAFVGNLVLLKIKPYQEEDYRYLVYNAKIQSVRRVDALKDACVLLPDDQGILFPNGYYLQTGEYKLFEQVAENMLFEKRISSPNGEDYLYVFYNRAEGLYLLLPYNLIEQQIGTPVYCHGFSIFENGEMCFFRGDKDAAKHHAVQIWQTPYIGPNFQLEQSSDSYLFKIGNREIVRAMAEARELLSLIHKGDAYADLYHDLIQASTALLDHYHWLKHSDAAELETPLREIRQTATTAVDEFEKVNSIRENTQQQSSKVLGEADELIRKIKRKRAEHILDFVASLSELRRLSGAVISLKELRYADLEAIEQHEKELQQFSKEVSAACVKFLLRDDALKPYQQQVQQLEKAIGEAAKVSRINELDAEASRLSGELEMLIEIVSNLKIEDATETTCIIDNISAIYAYFNKLQAGIRRKRRELMLVEGKAEFNAQIKLVEQGVINYIDVCDTPEKCDEYLTKLLVQLEELEGRFSEFDEYVEQLSVKRDEIYNAFESRKLSLTEARNKRANTLQQAAERILKAVSNRLHRFTEISEINGYFASDLMIEKLRSLMQELKELGDSVKADDIQSKLKTIKEDAVRQLKDKNDLYVAGENTIRLGQHLFSVNTQGLALSMVQREDGLYFHLAGTGFFEKIDDPSLNALREVWQQGLISENQQVYRAEYLAYKIMQTAQSAGEGETRLIDLQKKTDEELRHYVQQFMSTRYNEGYVKGVHDSDATIILHSLLTMRQTAGLLRYDSRARACAMLFWQHFVDKEQKKSLEAQLKGAAYILQVFPHTREFEGIQEELQEALAQFVQDTRLFEVEEVADAASFLFYALAQPTLVQGSPFVVAEAAANLYQAFAKQLNLKGAWKEYEQSVQALKGSPVLAFKLTRSWLRAFVAGRAAEQAEQLDEAAYWLLAGGYNEQQVVHAHLDETLEGLQGTHACIENKQYRLTYNAFMKRLRHFEQVTVPAYLAFAEQKKQLSARFAEALRLEEFKPRVMSSFVRNQLIDQVYLKLIGDNLAKQMGTAGEDKRTDLMGMLLLISPPGYGKTTLMEYLADRLGLVFMKINGPAIGHEVTAVDPADAKNSGARQELEKLNLAFEMGDNVMIYLDDIQHCNPEFLQKFISLCDGQRKIEGIYKGRAKTYDFRGKKVCVVMAGNPYTESGDKFRIPDMLANRADIYNLGDIIGDSAEVFKLSYVENCLTSNATLARLAGKSQKDVLTLVKVAETGSQEGLELEASHSPQEISEYVKVLKMLLAVRDVVLQVNMAYIHSAAQAEEYRTEPPFKLQGSYRNMNKLAEKIVPVMNERELDTLILSHYEGESQTLTSGAEANLLKFKELSGRLSEKEKVRWEEIKAIFRKSQQSLAYGGNHMGQLLVQVENVGHALYGIRSALSGQPYMLKPDQLKPQKLNELNGDGLASGEATEI
jgi:MoxR-like ATPase